MEAEAAAATGLTGDLQAPARWFRLGNCSAVSMQLLFNHLLMSKLDLTRLAVGVNIRLHTQLQPQQNVCVTSCLSTDAVAERDSRVPLSSRVSQCHVPTRTKTSPLKIASRPSHILCVIWESILRQNSRLIQQIIHSRLKTKD